MTQRAQLEFSTIPNSSGFAALMRRVLRHGDITAIARRLHIAACVIHDMLNGSRRSHFESAAITIETLRERGNPESEVLINRLNRRLGYQAYRLEGQQIDDVDFAELLRDFSNVVETRAKAETDHTITPDERRSIASTVDQLIACGLKYRDEQLALADDNEEPQPARRSA